MTDSGNRVRHRYGPDGVRLVTASFRTHRFQPHAHPEYAVAAVVRGVEAVRYRGATHHAPAGSLLLLDAAELHTGGPADAAGWDYRVCYLAPELLAELGGERPMFPDPVPHDPELAALLATVHRRAPGTATAEQLYTVVSAILARHARRWSPPVAPPAVVDDVIRHLHADLRRTPSLDELAAVTGLERFRLLRAFRRETGVTPHGYLLQLRLQRAQQVLSAGQPVARAAVESGFYDQAHLHRHFRRTFGATPGTFARKHVQDRRRRAP
ncbi:AraC family transcriptional regulator [Sciscionella sediminilitoris]|uniref:AraC family transcriptional regulator n=1 Tax=Sciscionella sediminilitoris TaxID=1445613 RepID=UPI0004DFA0D7|nr:AraC family transcriptional regulator [Sciscionella sp. SE31]